MMASRVEGNMLTVHMIFLEGICFSFDYILCPAYLLQMDPIMETYVLLRSLAFFNLCMYFGYALGSIFGAIASRRRIERLDPLLLLCSPLLFLLWASCANISMFVIVKLVQGSFLGYFRQSTFLFSNDSLKNILFILGVLFSAAVTAISFHPHARFGASSLGAGMFIGTILTILGVIQYFLYFIRSSAKSALRVPAKFQTPAKDKASLMFDRDEDLEASETLVNTNVPQRYIRGCGKDAGIRWRQTLEWREANDIDSILLEEQPQFALMKECYPQFFHGRAKDGSPVVYEQLGKINIQRLKQNGIDKTILLRHYLFLTEYLWAKVEPDGDNGQVCTVMDIRNVGVYDLMGDALEFLKLASKTIQLHYVERCSKMFIVNAPMFFNLIWRVVSPMLHENTRKKILILGEDKSELLKYIDAKQLPIEYGGTDTRKLGECKLEQDLRAFVQVIKPGVSSSNVARTPSKQSQRRYLMSTLSDKEPWLGGEESEHLEKDGGYDSDDSSDEGSHDEWEKLSLWTAATAKSAYSLASSSLGGLRERFTSGAATQKEATVIARKKEPMSNQAHLGSENAFHYDAASKRWVIDDASTSDVEDFDDNEREIIRAIEAAHENKVRSEDIRQWKRCDKNFLFLATLYFLGRVEIVAVLYVIPIALLLPAMKGGFGADTRSVALVVLIACLVQMIVLTAPYIAKTARMVDDIKHSALVALRAVSQLHGLALGTISIVAIIDRDFSLGVTTTYLVIALCLTVLLATLTSNTLGMNALYAIANAPLYYASSLCLFADTLGSAVGLLFLSILFGDFGISKYNSYIALPFLLAIAVHITLGYFGAKDPYAMYTSANYFLPLIAL